MQNVFDRVCRHFDIDSKLKLKIAPGKLPISSLKLLPRPEVVYYPHIGKLFSFYGKSHGLTVILSGVEPKGEDDGLSTFGPIDGFSYMYEYVHDDGQYHVYNVGCPWLTEIKVKTVNSGDESEDSSGTS